jgi:hypothetical protein
MHTGRCILPIVKLHTCTHAHAVQVGGYSVWSALPPIPDTNYSATPGKPITLVLAPLDTNTFFHDLARVRECMHL